MKKNIKLSRIIFAALFVFITVSGCKFNTNTNNANKTNTTTEQTKEPTTEPSNTPSQQPGGNNQSTIDPETVIDVFVPTKAPIPDSAELTIITENEEVPADISTGTPVCSTKIYNGESELIVTPQSNGLNIKKTHASQWVHISIHVFDKTDNCFNVGISTDENNNEFIYPFVKKDHQYKVYYTKADENWSGDYSDNNAVEVTSIGGYGNLCLTYSGYEYDSPSHSIVFSDLSLTKPAFVDLSYNISGTVYEEDWSGANVWNNGFKLTKSVLSMECVSSFLTGKDNIFVSLSYSFDYNNVHYEENLITNNDHLFVDTNTPFNYNPGKTGLPNIYLTTDDGNEINDKVNWVTGTIKITSNGGTVLLDSCAVELKGRGNSSWGTGKNPYTFKFAKKKDVLGLKENKRWVLLANYYDRSMVRSEFAAYLGNEIYNSTWNASFKPVNLYVNGIYRGTYDVGDQIKVGKNRVNIQSLEDYGTSSYKDVNNDGVIDLKDGGFIAEIDFRNGEDWHFYSDEYKLPFNFRDPDELDDDKFIYAKGIINAIEAMLKSDDFEDHYKDYIDEASMIDWWIMNEFSRNNDAIFQTSVYMYYNPVDGKMYMGPGWDYDLAYGNYWDKNLYEGFYIFGGKKPKGDDDVTFNNSDYPAYYESFWLNRLFDSDEFKQAAKARWQEKSTALNNAINQKIQNLADVIAPTIPCNEYLLPRLGEYSWNGPDDYDKRTTYKQEVDYLIEWCQNRYNWMNSEIATW